MDALQTCVLLVCLFGAADAFSCNITVKFRNDAHEKVRVDLLVPSLEVMSEPVILSEWKEQKHVKVHGNDCEMKHWIFMTYGWEKEEWVFKKKSQAKFTGNGWFLATVSDQFDVSVLDRYGIACSEGNCGK